MSTWEMPRQGPARRPEWAWQTIGAGHIVTIGRIGTGWYVEHAQVEGWRGQVCDSEQIARILADRERATVPGRSWLELRPFG